MDGGKEFHMQTFHVERKPCLTCGAQFEHSTCIASGQPHEPRPGDLVMCGQCGSIHRFAADLSPKALEKGELERLRERVSVVREIEQAFRQWKTNGVLQ